MATVTVEEYRGAGYLGSVVVQAVQAPELRVTAWNTASPLTLSPETGVVVLSTLDADVRVSFRAAISGSNLGVKIGEQDRPFVVTGGTVLYGSA